MGPLTQHRLTLFVVLLAFKQSTHHIRLNIVFLFLKQLLNDGVVAESRRVLLLNVVSTYTSERLNRFLLRHICQVFPDDFVAKLVIRAVNIVG